ncbi:MAG TPA: HAD family hydrolase [Candidatus Dormibacteraeota bacterium]|nr:HAD family hydrolase [Candidatus Dormibacteraeota bacterium]
MKRALEAALIDVGGTLWPNSWPIRQTDGAGRLARVLAALPELSQGQVDGIVTDLITSSRETHDGGAPNPHDYTRIGADILVADCLQRHQVSADASSVARVRRAMAIPVADRMRPLPGAIELLAQINALGLRCVIASNTYWRDAESYWEDFRLLGMADHVDAIVTSVDAGHLKPHPAVFELAMRAAGAHAEQCVYIGNKEDNDIEPALALGMRTILVHPDDPVPASSRADAVAPDLWVCAEALRAMLGES